MFSLNNNRPEFIILRVDYITKVKPELTVRLLANSLYGSDSSAQDSRIILSRDYSYRLLTVSPDNKVRKEMIFFIYGRLA